jgi:hypothetical protein
MAKMNLELFLKKKTSLFNSKLLCDFWPTRSLKQCYTNFMCEVNLGKNQCDYNEKLSCHSATLNPFLRIINLTNKQLSI